MPESVLVDLGCKIFTAKGVREVSRNGEIVLRVVNKRGLYFVQLSPKVNIANASYDSHKKFTNLRPKKWTHMSICAHKMGAKSRR